MKRFAKTLCVAAVALCTSMAVADTIGTVNMEQIFKTSPQVKSINASLQKQFASKKEAIVKQGKGLQSDLQNFNKNKSVMSKSDAKKLAQKIAKEEADLRTAQASFQQALFAAQNKAMKKFMGTVDAAVATVAKQDKLDLVLPKSGVVYAKDGKDITSSVVSAMK